MITLADMLKYIIKAKMTYPKQICHIFENDNKKPPAHNRRGVGVSLAFSFAHFLKQGIQQIRRAVGREGEAQAAPPFSRVKRASPSMKSTCSVSPTRRESRRLCVMKTREAWKSTAPNPEASALAL